MTKLFARKNKYGGYKPTVEESYVADLARNFLFAMQSGAVVINITPQDMVKLAFDRAEEFVKYALAQDEIRVVPEEKDEQSE